MTKLLAIAADINPEDFGGAEYHFVEVLKRIYPEFSDTVVVLGKSQKLKNLFPQIPTLKFVTVTYPRLKNLVGLMYVIFALPKVIFLSLSLKPDVIWAKQEFPQGVLGVFAKWLTGAKLIVTSQSAKLYQDELVVSGLPKFVTGAFTYIGRLLVGFSFRHADIVSAVSSYSKTEAIGLGAKHVVVVPNAIDLSMFKPRAKKSHTHFTIVSTSSLIPRNGLVTLIKGCALLPKDLTWQLKIAGIGSDKELLENLAKNVGVADRVIFLGFIDNKFVPDLLAESDVFARVSNAEGFGSSFLEAMAMELPVIASPVGGIVDFITDQKTGFLVNPGDAHQLSKTLTFIAKNPKLVKSITTKARAEILENYTWPHIARKFKTDVLKLTHA